MELKWRCRVPFQEKTQTQTSLSWIQLCSLCSKAFRVMERKLFQPPVSPLCLHRSAVMMTLRRDSAAGGVRLSLLSSLKANIRQRLHHSFVFHCARCAAGCTLIKHASVFFLNLWAKFYLLGSILFGASLFWLLSKHNYVVVITLFHAAQELLKCLTFFFSVPIGSTHKGGFRKWCTYYTKSLLRLLMGMVLDRDWPSFREALGTFSGVIKPF